MNLSPAQAGRQPGRLMRKFCPTCLEEFVTDEDLCAECSEELVPLKDDSLVGQVLEKKYAITKELGKGGMGIVYVAKQKYLDREVAVKVLRKEMATDSTSVKRFMLEAKAASNLSSPHTVTIHDFGITGEQLLFFVMEKLRGKALGDIIEDDGAMDPQRSVEIICQVCRSLSEAHSFKIWHRDLKPDNIFITPREDGTEHAKVLDFGIAKFAGENTQVTATGMVCGTPQYLSPEQAQGGELDGRTDVYSLGIVLYEMLAGVPPFTGGTPVQVLLSHIKDIPPPLTERNPDARVPAALVKVIDKALQKDADRRISSADEFAVMLREAMKDHADDHETMAIPPLDSAAGVRSVGESDVDEMRDTRRASGGGGETVAYSAEDDLVDESSIPEPDGPREIPAGPRTATPGQSTEVSARAVQPPELRQAETMSTAAPFRKKRSGKPVALLVGMTVLTAIVLVFGAALVMKGKSGTDEDTKTTQPARESSAEALPGSTVTPESGGKTTPAPEDVVSEPDVKAIPTDVVAEKIDVAPPKPDLVKPQEIVVDVMVEPEIVVADVHPEPEVKVEEVKPEKVKTKVKVIKKTTGKKHPEKNGTSEKKSGVGGKTDESDGDYVIMKSGSDKGKKSDKTKQPGDKTDDDDYIQLP
jgi:serine/threonine protein kinase